MDRIKLPGSPALCLTALLSLLIFVPAAAVAGNLMLERSVAEQLARPSLTGQALWLDADGVRFLSILETARAPERIGGVILLHDEGEHADWQQVIAPLRHHLAEKGWDVLALQMPMTADLEPTPASPDPLLEEALPRIRVALERLKNRGIETVALVGHGLGARMALHYLTGNPPPAVRAFVAIGLSADPARSDDPVTSAIGKLKVPTLDLFGSRDLPAVIDSAPARLAAARRGKLKDYRQDRLEGADHYFDGLQTNLERRIEAWLRREANTPSKPDGANH